MASVRPLYLRPLTGLSLSAVRGLRGTNWDLPQIFTGGQCDWAGFQAYIKRKIYQSN